MRTPKGFTLIELVVALAIAAVLGGLVIRQGLSARQSASIAGGAWELGLQLGATKSRAVADARDYLIVVIDADNPTACVRQVEHCGMVIVLRNPTAAFTINGFDPTPPIANAELVDGNRLPVNTQLDLASTWTPPAPFDALAPFDAGIRATCGGGRACFAIRYKANGDVSAVYPGGVDLNRSGFAFVLRPVDSDAQVAHRRGLLVSFPAGLVKTAAF